MKFMIIFITKISLQFTQDLHIIYYWLYIDNLFDFLLIFMYFNILSF